MLILSWETNREYQVLYVGGYGSIQPVVYQSEGWGSIPSSSSPCAEVSLSKILNSGALDVSSGVYVID